MIRRPFSSLGLLFDIVLTAAVILAFYAAMYIAFAVFNVPAEPQPVRQQSDLACAHYQTIGQSYKCGRA